ncbi:phage portal protein [Clostridium beijerinckii]|uniref:SPP1 family phage portal protein n=1 Tax=Clostridium beijerinckii TaxID=1520 RepID=A0AAX0BAK6_CLOBE|nr:phage portal protein [Clostridium beijerinckii]NRT91508.1 SPP1 family phage portal protein [Clostridium beijerinckii]NYC71033.1 SPP1 family phage portal protein [Clostridium beijerinckii]UYZ34157.1 phage portal protein [Clostridium beijerinckii]
MIDINKNINSETEEVPEINLDIEAVKQCYARYRNNLDYYLTIDKDYFGNTDELKPVANIPNRSNARIKTNFIQKLVDEEALYSFGNKITYKALDEKHKNAIPLIDYHFKNNGAGYDNSSGKRLIEFHLGYELNFITKDNKFKNLHLNPLNSDIWLNEYNEPEFFIYVHSKNVIRPPRKKPKLVDFIDVYDSKYTYYLDEAFDIKEIKAHNMGTLPVGYGVVDNVRYTEENGYIEGDKTIHRTTKTLQLAIEQNCSDITQEITDFHNAILKFYGVDLEDEVDDKGNVVLDNEGNPVKKEPIIGNNSVLYFDEKQKADAEWLIKKIDGSFIKETRDDFKDLIYTLTSHIDNNMKLESNLSGVALRSRLQSLEAKVKANEAAMEDIIRKRLQCLFNWLRLTSNGAIDYDENLISIEFTPCVPQDIQIIAQIIAQIPHDVLSNETKRSLLPFVTVNEVEEERIKREDREKLQQIDFSQSKDLGDNNDGQEQA